MKSSHEPLERLRDLAHSDGPPHDLYALDAILQALPARERAEAERYALGVWGLAHRTLADLKASHAWSIALGRDVDAAPAGRWAFHVFAAGEAVAGGEELGEDQSVLAEELIAVEQAEPDALGRFLGVDVDTLAGWSIGELRDALEGEGYGDLFDPPVTAFPRLVEAGSLAALLSQVAPLVGLGDDDVTDEALDRQGDTAAFKAIRDAALRGQAIALSGRWQLMELCWEPETTFYCRGITLRRPGWSFFCAWDAVPHRQDEGWCILYRPDT